VLLGVAWPFALLHLFALSWDVHLVHLPVARIVTAFGAAEYSWPVVRTVLAALWALIFGVLFGIPLGLGVRGKVAVYWLVFLASVNATIAFMSLGSPFGIGVLLLEWSMPETGVYMLAVLCFAHWTARLRARREWPSNRALLRTAYAALFLVAIAGAVNAAFSIAALYMVWSGFAEPGQVIYLGGERAPTTNAGLLTLSASVVAICLGLLGCRRARGRLGNAS
jgi:hypothetical protein